MGICSGTVGIGPDVRDASTRGPARRFASSGWPTLTVNNATRSGSVGALVYKFEVSASSAFGSLVVSATARSRSTAVSSLRCR